MTFTSIFRWSLARNTKFLAINALLIFLNLLPIYGQKHEVGLALGGTYYLGDLNPSRQFALTGISFGANYRFNINSRMALRANLLYGNIAGDDAVLKFNENRNLRFTSQVWEAAALFEINFLPFEAGNANTPASPFLMAGLGVIHFNPKTLASVGGVTTQFHLPEFQTENISYSLFTHSLIFGVGMRYNLVGGFILTFEWSMRQTGSDYLDDVSGFYPDLSALSPDDPRRILSDPSLMNPGENAGLLRGNPNTRDWFSFAGFSLSFRIRDTPWWKCP